MKANRQQVLQLCTTLDEHCLCGTNSGYGKRQNDRMLPIAMWRGKLTGGAQRMFDILVSIYPASLTREEVGEQAGLGPTTGTFGTYLSQLRSNELIEVSNGRIKASDNLFV